MSDQTPKTLAFVLLGVLVLGAFFGPFMGPVNTGSARYNYGPSIFYDAGLWKAWWCSARLGSAGTPVGGDAIWYAQSYDAINWGVSRQVFEPSSVGWDSYHVCDPSVLRDVTLAGVRRPFVMYYTGTNGAYGGDNDGRIGVAWSSDGKAWNRIARLTLGCENPAALGCQHFSAVKMRSNAPDPAFGGRYIATVSRTSTDQTTGTYVMESPDGLNWWGNAGVPGSPAKRLTFPGSFGSQYMSAGVDLMYDSTNRRYLLTFTGTEIGASAARDYVFRIPAHWYGGMNTDAVLEPIAYCCDNASFVPGFFRGRDGYRIATPGFGVWDVYTMTSDKYIRDNGQPRQTQLIWYRWFR